MNLRELKAKTPAELLSFAEELQIENAGTLRKQDMMFAILKSLAEKDQAIYGEGVLEVLQDGFGFLRSPESNNSAGSAGFQPASVFRSTAEVSVSACSAAIPLARVVRSSSVSQRQSRGPSLRKKKTTTPSNIAGLPVIMKSHFHPGKPSSPCICKTWEETTPPRIPASGIAVMKRDTACAWRRRGNPNVS